MAPITHLVAARQEARQSTRVTFFPNLNGTIVSEHINSGIWNTTGKKVEEAD